jgi:hypothetical protein
MKQVIQRIELIAMLEKEKASLEDYMKKPYNILIEICYRQILDFLNYKI